MNINELHQLHMQKLTKAFGVSTALSAFANDRAARAFGNHYSEDGSHDTGRSEY
jgi:hypothetical protein